jgi:hypothetical protein
VARNLDPFKLALQRLSVAQLKKLIVKYQKRAGDSVTKDDYVRVLSSTMNDADRLDAMRSFILAGKGSMSLIQFADEEVAYGAEVNFDKAGSIPKIVHIGRKNQIHEGQRHIQWAVVVGQNTFIDTELKLNVDAEADVIDSFYDDDARILQIRSNSAVAGKIVDAWAAMHEIDPVKMLKPLGIKDLAEFHEFVDFIDGSVVKAKGTKIESRGFDKVSGELHPLQSDLRGTEDYTEFCSEVAVTDTYLRFGLGGEVVKLGFGFASRTTVFATLVNEAVYSHVYGKLKEFFNR